MNHHFQLHTQFCQSVFATSLYKQMSKLLCLPWIVGNVFNLLILSSLLLLIFMRMLNEFQIVELEKAGFILLTMGAMIYAIWIVIAFFLELNNGTRKSKNQVKSMFTLYDDEDEETGEVKDILPNKQYFSKRPSKERQLNDEKEDEERVPLTDYDFGHSY
ncbi:unnamed protein product [Orchesella dallaii]|uniref:Transmembrane protein n=1 Tax=Orchesella dallaii TaxID=48710 RepID=A0ABP1QFC3_9HEXA